MLQDVISVILKSLPKEIKEIETSNNPYLTLKWQREMISEEKIEQLSKHFLVY